jgi:hypothetical protein
VQREQQCAGSSSYSAARALFDVRTATLNYEQGKRIQTVFRYSVLDNQQTNGSVKRTIEWIKLFLLLRNNLCSNDSVSICFADEIQLSSESVRD